MVDAEKTVNGWELIAEAANTGGISQSTLERILCDCTITRVVTKGASQVLDVGRATRSIPHAQWSAVVARDRVCTDCGRPPGDCQVHHKKWWVVGGETNIDDLELKCDYCHRAAHEQNPIQRT